MSSPFPGTDPYIESCGLWGDFHQSLIAEIKIAIARSAPERYVVRTGEREYLELIQAEGPKKRAFIPDVEITEPARRKKANGGNAVAVANPEIDAGAMTMRSYIEEENEESFVEIFDTRSRQRLVTSNEVLSPTNKRRGSKGRKIYRRKRKSLMLGNVNFVEIDLLRGGERLPMTDPWPKSPYALLVSRSSNLGTCRVWPAHSLKRLPVIPIPLAKPDPDLSIDLQPIIEGIYRLSRYERNIDYRQASEPPLSSEEAAWLKKHLRVRARGT
jgi:hypothetical protein